MLGMHYYLFGMDYVLKTYVYPMPYSNLIEKYARSNNVSPALVAGVALAESKFKKEATSNTGALGLMQLMPETAHWIAEEMNQPKMTDADIKEPAANIQLGTWYLAYLLDEFKGNEVLALAAYNAGRGHVEEWMKEFGWGYDFTQVSAIPFPETRTYVRTVLENKDKYAELYK